jgi:hypothetical protein
VSFIIPNKFLAAEYAQAFRQVLLEQSRFVSMLDLSRVKVWSASVYPVVPVFERSRPATDSTIGIQVASEQGLGSLRELEPVPHEYLRQLPDGIWSCLTQSGIPILLKVLRTYPETRLALCNISLHDDETHGRATGLDL